MNLIFLVAVFLVSVDAAQSCFAPSCYSRPPCTSNRLCVGKKVGYYRYEFNYRLFYYCNTLGNNAGCQTCPARLWFSRKCLECLRRPNAIINKCSGGKDTKPGPEQFCVPKGFCEHRPNGLYGDTTDATKFFNCVNGKSTQCQSCPAGLVFSEACQGCLLQQINDKKDCQKGWNTPSGPKPSCSLDAQCRDKQRGWYTMANNLNIYYFCNHRYQNAGCQQCPSGLSFSTKCVQCLPYKQAVLHQCEKEDDHKGGSVDLCAPTEFCQKQEKELNYLFSVPSDLTKFFSCNKNKQASPCQSCAAGLVFNEVCQTCSYYTTDKENECRGAVSDNNNVIKRCPDHICYGRSAGDYEKNQYSETYVTCLANGKCLLKWCPASGLMYSKVCGSCNTEYITDVKNCQSNKPSPGPLLPQCQADKGKTFCFGKNNGVHSPPANSNEPAYVFYNCFNQKCFRQKCLKNLVFVPKIKGCARSSDY